KSLFTRKPPVHFHVQEEYIESLEGKLGLEIEGKEFVLVPTDGTYTIASFVNHRSYPLPEDRQNGGEIVRFRLSGEKTSNPYELSPVFFENWYKYQNEVVANGAQVSLIQFLSTFDAGGSYISLPAWVPFGQTISRTLGVVVGRWIGGLLGYQPFYRKWTTDWDLACAKMDSSFFQRRFSGRDKSV
ncbi:putative oxidoreductase yanE, partial [Lachnellula suecica]